MAIAPVQHADGSGTTTANATLSSTGSTGHILHANVFWHSNTKTVTVSDNKSGPWSALGSPKTGPIGGGIETYSFQQFVCLMPVAATTQVTATEGGGGGDTVNLNAHEWSGFAATPTLDGSPVYTAYSNPAQTPTAGPISSTIAVAILIAASFPSGSTTAIVSAPFTDQSGASGDSSWGSGSYGYEVVSSTQSGVSATFHADADDNITGIFVVGDATSGFLKSGAGIIGP